MGSSCLKHLIRFALCCITAFRRQGWLCRASLTSDNRIAQLPSSPPPAVFQGSANVHDAACVQSAGTLLADRAILTNVAVFHIQSYCEAGKVMMIPDNQINFQASTCLLAAARVLVDTNRGSAFAMIHQQCTGFQSVLHCSSKSFWSRHKLAKPRISCPFARSTLMVQKLSFRPSESASISLCTGAFSQQTKGQEVSSTAGHFCQSLCLFATNLIITNKDAYSISSLHTKSCQWSVQETSSRIKWQRQQLAP